MTVTVHTNGNAVFLEMLTVQKTCFNYQLNAQFVHSITIYMLNYVYGLVVSILATGTRVRGFKPGRSRWIFRVFGKSSVCLPSEGK